MAVLVQMNGLGFSFQVWIQARMSASRKTLVVQGVFGLWVPLFGVECTMNAEPTLWDAILPGVLSGTAAGFGGGGSPVGRSEFFVPFVGLLFPTPRDSNHDQPQRVPRRRRNSGRIRPRATRSVDRTPRLPRHPPQPNLTRVSSGVDPGS